VPAPPGGAVVDPRDDGVPATQRVVELCRKLGFQAPVYQLVAVAGAGSGVWDGEADFGRDALLVPAGVGRVEGVFGKQRAKEAMAEGVLGFLLREEERRERTWRLLEGDE